MWRYYKTHGESNSVSDDNSDFEGIYLAYFITWRKWEMKSYNKATAGCCSVMSQAVELPFSRLDWLIWVGWCDEHWFYLGNKRSAPVHNVHNTDLPIGIDTATWISFLSSINLQNSWSISASLTHFSLASLFQKHRARIFFSHRVYT